MIMILSNWDVGARGAWMRTQLAGGAPTWRRRSTQRAREGHHLAGRPGRGRAHLGGRSPVGRPGRAGAPTWRSVGRLCRGVLAEWISRSPEVGLELSAGGRGGCEGGSLQPCNTRDVQRRGSAARSVAGAFSISGKKSLVEQVVGDDVGSHGIEFACTEDW